MDGVMIALLPTTDEWCNIDFPHMTLVFAGQVEEHPPTDFNRIAKDAASIAMMVRQFTIPVMKVGPMGPPEDQVAALLFRKTPELEAMRNFVEGWNRSEYHEFVPHTTIGQYPINPDNLPKYLSFNRIVAAWGDERLIFWLRP